MRRTQATLVGKHKTFKGLVEISKNLNGKRYAFLFTEGAKDAVEPRPMYIFYLILPFLCGAKILQWVGQ
ncbi:MAG: hypothetical protein LBS94_05545 [Prevotellaceae bacterium]|nr:hypothetical protein [Prevotellaceae bacterium]